MQAFKIIYLYRVINKINNKVYIGQTINPSSRWYSHKSRSADDNPKQIIHRAIKKYGSSVFEFEVIACSTKQNDADWAEETLIQQYKSLAPNGYNIEMGGIKSPAMSQATKEKIAILAVQRFQLNPELRTNLRNIGIARNQALKEQGLTLPIHTPEIKQKSMAAFQAARDGYRQKYGFDWNYEAFHSLEFRKRNSERMSELIQSLPQHWLKGRKLSPEQMINHFKRTTPLSPSHKLALVEGGRETQFKIGIIPYNKKLTPEIAEEMKLKYIQGISIRALSREYNINRKSISYMLKDKTHELSSARKFKK